jgi:prepilin-type N-terminal cleavage/methylation domain-containing protein
MKSQMPFASSRRRGPTATGAGFTLPELMISITVFLLVVGGVVSANLFGLRMFQITENKLSASDAARKAIGQMTDEIRTCNSAWVGNISNGTFVAHLNGEAQTGNGLQICPTTNASNFIIYFINASDQSFRRTTSAAGSTTVLARSVTNAVAFRAQDFSGNVLTNNQNNRVIHFDLEFLQPARYGVVADSYKLETSMTRRALQ